jgi:hypothetical protein
MDLNDEILNSIGGKNVNSLPNLIEDDNDVTTTTIVHSPYVEELKLGDVFKNSDSYFNVLSLNIDSLHAKHEELQLFLENIRLNKNRFDAILIQETWLAENDDLSLLQLRGYNMISKGKTCGRKGGLSVYLDEAYTHRVLNFPYTSSFWENQFLEISGNGLLKKLLLWNIYRPPRDTFSDFKKELQDTLTLIDQKNYNIIIGGDFNINLLNINNNNDTSEFFELLTSFGYYPKITMPTRFSNKRGTLIDNFFCNFSDDSTFIKSGILLDKISDHQPYFMSFKKNNITSTMSKYVKVTKQSEEAHISFYEELLSRNIQQKIDVSPTANPNINTNIIANELKTAKEKHFPTKFVKFNKYKHKKNNWITFGILKSMKHKNSLYKKLRKTREGTANFLKIKKELEDYNIVLRKSIRLAKTSYYQNNFELYKNDIKKTWSTINDILNKTRKKKHFPEYFCVDDEHIHDKLEIANKFNIYFTNIGPKLASTIDQPVGKSFTTFLNKKISSKLSFHEVTSDHVSKIIDKLRTKLSFGFDGISTKLLKYVKHILLLPLTVTINQSLKTGIFPEMLKIAKVIPLFKKDNNAFFVNYRPISLLPSISKIFERVIFEQLYEYFQANKLLYKSQYGFRKLHNTELAAIELIEKIYSELDSGQIPISIFLDLSKAFDTLDHKILLKKLHYYGLLNTSYGLLESYITNRKQYVEFEGTCSSSLYLTTGVPQGSILGPLLFLIYMNDISHACSSIDCILYADDTTLSSTLKTVNNSIRISESEINKELSNVSDWLKLNKLSVNASKTKCMIFHSIQRATVNPNIILDNTPVEIVDHFNFLGIVIDKHMNFKAHVDKICIKISRAIGVMNKLKNFLPESILLTLYNSLVLPHLNYGILAWGTNLKRARILQKRAVKVITKQYDSHSSPLFKRLHLLTIDDLYRLNCLKFYHRFVNENLPLPLQNLSIQTNSSVHEIHTRQSTFLHVPRKNTELGKKSLCYSLPILVNSQPKVIVQKATTHSLHGFSVYAKNLFISNYKSDCLLENCYICQKKRTTTI